MKSKETKKTNVARLLDHDNIKYELVAYEVDENDLSAVHVAESLGEDIKQVFKTIVLHGDKSGNIVCVVPGDAEVDLKCSPGKRKQKMFSSAFEGAASYYGIYPRRLLAYRNEEAFSHIYRLVGKEFRRYIR